MKLRLTALVILCLGTTGTAQKSLRVNGADQETTKPATVDIQKALQRAINNLRVSAETQLLDNPWYPDRPVLIYKTRAVEAKDLLEPSSISVGYNMEGRPTILKLYVCCPWGINTDAWINLRIDDATKPQQNFISVPWTIYLQPTDPGKGDIKLLFGMFGSKPQSYTLQWCPFGGCRKTRLRPTAPHSRAGAEIFLAHAGINV